MIRSRDGIPPPWLVGLLQTYK